MTGHRLYCPHAHIIDVCLQLAKVDIYYIFQSCACLKKSSYIGSRVFSQNLCGAAHCMPATWFTVLAARTLVASAQLASRAADSAMEFAVLGHTAEYLLGRSGALLQIERWAPTSRYHLVTTSQKEARRTTEQLPNGALPLARTSVHSTESLPHWAAS